MNYDPIAILIAKGLVLGVLILGLSALVTELLQGTLPL